MVVSAPAAASKRARDEEETFTATFLLEASAPPPFGDLELEPISAVPRHPRTPSPDAGREEPPCLRKHFLVALGLRADLPVQFIDEKCLMATDLDPHQNRLLLPRDGVIHRLRPLLTPTELHDANLFLLPATKPKRRSGDQTQQQPEAAEPQNDASSSADGTKKIKKPKAQGKVHGGLGVKLVNLDAGAKDMLLSRWESSSGTIVKGQGYIDFIRECGLKANDTIEVWAFVQRRFRLFGKDIFGDSLLHVLIVKKDDQPQQCRYCRPIMMSS